MNKRRVVFEVTVDESQTAIDVMTAVFQGLGAAKLATDARVILLDDRAVFEGVVARAEVGR